MASGTSANTGNGCLAIVNTCVLIPIQTTNKSKRILLPLSQLCVSASDAHGVPFPWDTSKYPRREEEDGVMPTRYFSRAQAHTSSGGSADAGTPPLILFLLTCAVRKRVK